jgi:hypothetical protein
VYTNRHHSNGTDNGVGVNMLTWLVVGVVVVLALVVLANLPAVLAVLAPLNAAM